MKSVYTVSFAALLAIAGLSFSFMGNKACNTVKDAEKGFAVVELFTSEGCSSCPPADDAAIKLAKEFPDRVYFLGFHVDYWDYIGWKDAYANPVYTKRQQAYAETFHLSSVYTPQVVVNGKKELVGSRENQLRTIIQDELKELASSVIELTGKTGVKNTVTATYKVTTTGKSFLHIALVQLNAVTQVKRGENGGHILNHINIVREFKTIAANNQDNDTMEFTMPQGLSAKEVKLIAFIEDKNNSRITGAVEAIVEQ